MTEYQDYIPANAEIVVDYKKPPMERVEFTYPVKFRKDGGKLGKLYTFQTIFFCSFFGCLIVEIALLCIYSLFVLIIRGYFFIFLFFLYGIFFGGLGQTYTICTGCVKPPIASAFTLTSVLTPSNLLFFSLWIASISITAYLYYEKKTFANWFPQFNYWWNRKDTKELLVHPSQVNEKCIIIPHFSNVYLDWSATKDFSKYLEKVEIKRLATKATLVYYPKRKRQPRMFNYYALFKFSKVPKKGSIRILFV